MLPAASHPISVLPYGLVSIGICVGDLDHASDWYRSVLGFEMVADIEVAAQDLRLRFLRHGTVGLELIAGPGTSLPTSRPPLHVQRGGLTHFAFAVASLAATRQQLGALGIEILWEMSGDRPFIFIADPDGNCVQLIEAPAV